MCDSIRKTFTWLPAENIRESAPPPLNTVVQVNTWSKRLFNPSFWNYHMDIIHIQQTGTMSKLPFTSITFCRFSVGPNWENKYTILAYFLLWSRDTDTKGFNSKAIQSIDQWDISAIHDHKIVFWNKRQALNFDLLDFKSHFLSSNNF